MNKRSSFWALPVAGAALMLVAGPAAAFGSRNFSGASKCSGSTYYALSKVTTGGSYVYGAFTSPQSVQSGCNYDGTAFNYSGCVTGWIDGYGTIYNYTNNGPTGGAHRGGKNGDIRLTYLT